MKQYTVTGMSCAACSARVEKAVSKVPGVTACSVSLLTNSMGVEGTAYSAGNHRCRAGRGLRRKRKGRGGTPSARAEAEEAARGPRYACAQAAAHLVAGLFDRADVLLHGPYDVGLAAARTSTMTTMWLWA